MKYNQLVAETEVANLLAIQKESELKEKHEKELKIYIDKITEIQKTEVVLREEISDLKYDYDNIRVRFMQAQRAANKSCGETSDDNSSNDRGNEESETERAWLLFQEAIESFRNELEDLNLAYTSCRNHFKQE